MYYVAHYQPATCAIQTLKCDFREAGVDDLIIGKGSIIEVHALDPNGLQLKHEIPINEIVTNIEAVRLPGQDRSSLLLLTSRLDFICLSYDPSSPHSVRTESSASIAELGNVGTLERRFVLVDPAQRCLVVHSVKGTIRVCPLGKETGKGRRGSAKGRSVDDGEQGLDLSRGFSARLPDLNVVWMTLVDIPSSPNPCLAYICIDHKNLTTLRTRTISLRDREIGDGPVADVVLEDQGSELIIPVKNGAEGEGNDAGEAGVIVVGEEDLVWKPLQQVSDEKGKGKGSSTSRSVQCTMPLGIINAFCPIDDDPSRFLLGDEFGNLRALKLTRDSSGRVTKLETEDIGEVSPPSSLVYLANGFLFVGSTSGDSQLVRLPDGFVEEPSNEGDSTGDMEVDQSPKSAKLDVVSSFTSLAPIVDFRVVEDEVQGQSYVVTCSGKNGDGSLRIVRHGVGLSELASLELEGVQRMWTLRRNTSSELSDVLVASLVNETRLLSFADADTIEELPSLPGFQTDVQTLAAGNLESPSGLLAVQITPKGLGAFDTGSGERVDGWQAPPGRKVTVAGLSGPYAALALEGGELVLVEWKSGGLSVVGSLALPSEVSCLDIHLPEPGTNSKPFIAVGLWASPVVSLYGIPDLRPSASISLETSYLVRSVLAATFADGVTNLFIGLGDGTLISYVLDGESSIVGMSRKSVSLGKRPITLARFKTAGDVSVFASTNRPTIVSRRSDRLNYLSVNLKDINAFTSLNATAFPDSLALAFNDGIRIGRIDEIQRLHIRTLDLGREQPVRIAHDPAQKAFGVLCYREDFDRENGNRYSSSSFKILDDTSFELLGDFPLDDNERGTALSVLSTETSTSFAVGTAFVYDGEHESRHGRIVTFSRTNLRPYRQTAEIKVKGHVSAIAQLARPYFVASQASRIIAFSLGEGDDEIQEISSWASSFYLQNVVTKGDSVLACDMMHSVVLLQFDSNERVLKELARDYQPRWMQAADFVGDRDFLCTDMYSNLITLKHDSESAATSRSVLSSMGRFHLGEIICSFRPGSLVPDLGESTGASPLLIFGTSSGSLGMIGQVDGDAAKILSDLERNMRQVLKPVGGLSQLSWRSFRVEQRLSEPAGFIDGDFVEQFGDLDQETAVKVLEGGTESERIDAPLEEVYRVIEMMQRMH